MAISDQQKIDFLFKKLGFGATKTDTNALKAAVNEEIPSPLLLSGNNLWTDAAAIPSTKPSSSSDIVECYQDAAGGNNTVQTSMLGTASTNRSWTTGLTDWIPPQFGATYQIKVYIDNAGAANPESTGTQLFAAGSGNNDEWFFDYASGVLNFIGTNLPSGIGSKRIFIAGARYVGKLGNRFTTLFVDSGVYEHTTVDSTDITMADIITAYIDSADIMHAIIDSADITLGRISTVQATNLTADSAHIKTLSADSLSLSELTANIITANQLQGPANFVIDPAGVGDATGLVQILGNLQVEGTTTTINSTTVSLNDKNLVLADSATNAAAANDAGITINGAAATILYKTVGDKWEVNKDFHVPNLNADSADISLLRSDSAVITNAAITNLDVDSARLKIFQLDSGRIGKIQLIDSAKATNITVGTLTGDNIDVDSARFRRIDAQSFGITGTSPNRVLVADANNVVGTSINFVASASQVNLYSSAIQLHNTGFIDVTGGFNAGSGSQILPQSITTNNLHTARIKITDMPVKRVPFTANDDSLTTSNDLQFGQQTSRFHAGDGLTVGFNPLQDSGNFGFSVEKTIGPTQGKFTSFGGFKVGRSNEIPTGQFIFNYPHRLTADQQAKDNMGQDHNRPFYGLELNTDSGQLVSTAFRNEFLSPVLQSVPSAAEKAIIDVKGLEDSSIFRVFADGSVDFFGNLRSKGVSFAGGGIFDKDSNTQNAFFLRRDNVELRNTNPNGFGFVDMNPTIGRTGRLTTFIARPDHRDPTTHQSHSNVIQREKYHLSVNGNFAIRGDIDSSSVDFVINPGSVFNWTDPATGVTSKVNFADDSDKSRLLYVPSKAIFRAGLLRDSSIRKLNMGMFSVGAGYEPLAKGVGSIAMGVGAKALGDHSISLGQANDNRSTLNIKTIGIGTENLHDSNSATTQKTTLIGHGNAMRGNNAVVIGVDNNAPVNLVSDDGNNTPLGVFLPGAGDNSVIIGTQNKLGNRSAAAAANGAASVVIGRLNDLGATTAMYTMGTSNRTTIRGAGAYTFGAGNYIDAGQAMAIGVDHTVLGPSSTAIGTKATTDSNADFSVIVGLDNSGVQRVGAPNIFSVQGGNIILGDSVEHFSAVQYQGVSNLYVKGSIIVGGSLLQENAPGVTSSTTPFVDDGRDVTSNIAGTVRRFGFNTSQPYQGAVYETQEGFHVSGTTLTPGVTGQNGYFINPYPFTEDDQDPPQLRIPNVEQDSAIYDSTSTHNSMMSYITKIGSLRIGTHTGGTVYADYLRPGRVGFQSSTIGKDNINAGLRTTVIGQDNNIQRGGGPKRVHGQTTPLNPGDSLNPASLRASDMIVIGNRNVYDSAATGKKNLIFGDDNIVKGAAENKIVIGSFVKTQPNTTLSGSGVYTYDKEIVMKHADSYGQDSLNNTHVSIGKFGMGFYGETQLGPRSALDVRGDIHLDSGSTILIGDPEGLTRLNGTTGKGVKELPLTLFRETSQSPASNPLQRTSQHQFDQAVGGGVASITTDGNNRILVTTNSAHGLSNDSVTAINIVGTSADEGGGNGVTGINSVVFIPSVVDATSFLLLQDSFQSASNVTLGNAFFRSGVQGFDEDGDAHTVTKVGNGGTTGTVNRLHYRRPLRLGDKIDVSGDIAVAGRGALFRVDSLGVGFTATGDGSLVNQIPMSYNFTNDGFNITGTNTGRFISINGDSFEKFITTPGRAIDSYMRDIIDQDYIQARVSTDEFFVNAADALFFKPDVTNLSAITKPVQIGLHDSETSAADRSNFALIVKTKSGNGVINVIDANNTINPDTTSPIKINGANWPTDNYLKNIIDGPYIQSQVSVSNSTITSAINEAYLATIIDSDYVRTRVKDSDEWQTNADGTVLHYGVLPNVANVKVGIGTQNPRSKLEVTGGLIVDSGTFEGPISAIGHTLNDSATWTFDVDSGDIFLNDNTNNINANHTILNTSQIQARIVAAGATDSDFTVDLGGVPDLRFIKVFKKPQGHSAGDSVNLGTQPNAGIDGIVPKDGGGTGHVINFGAWRFDPSNPQIVRFRKVAFESDGSGNIIDEELQFRDRRLNTTISLTGIHHSQGNGYDGNPLVFKVHPDFNTVQRIRNGEIIDSSVAGVTTSNDGLTITINTVAANTGFALGDSIFTSDIFKVVDQRRDQISGLTVHGPTIFTAGGAADSSLNKSGLVIFEDSARVNGRLDVRGGATFADSITISQFTTSGAGAGGRGTPDGAGGKVTVDGYMIFDSNIAATIAPDELNPGQVIAGQGGMGNSVAATVRASGFSGQSGFVSPAETNPNHPLAAQNRFKMFREVRDKATKVVIDRRLMGFDSNVFTIIDSAYVGSKLNTDTQWNFGTDARQVSSLFYQGAGGVIIGGDQSSIRYVDPYGGGGALISDSDTKLQVNQGNVIFKQDAWDGIGNDNTNDIVPPIGEGSRFMWIPQRAALRAGATEAGAGKAPNGQTMEADANDDLFIGQSSIAMGANSTAWNYGVALGYKVAAGQVIYQNETPALRNILRSHTQSIAIGYDVDNRAKSSVAIGQEIEMSAATTGAAVQQHAVAIGYEITNASRSNTVTIGNEIAAFQGTHVGQQITHGNGAGSDVNAVSVGRDISISGGSIAVGGSISANSAGVIVGHSGSSASRSAVSMGVSVAATTSAVMFGRSMTSGQSAVGLGISNSVGRNAVSVGRSNSVTTNGVGIGISNSTSSNSQEVAIGIGNTTTQTGISIGVQNTDNGRLGMGIGFYNSNNTFTSVAVGISNADNTGAIVVGRGNTGNKGYNINSNKTLVYGLNNTNNGKRSNVFGNHPMVIFGIDNFENVNGEIYGSRNTNIQGTTIFGNDNANIVNGDGAYIFGTGGAVEKKITSSSVSGGMQFGANNTTIDNGFVFGTTNTGRQAGHAYGAGNYAWLQGMAYGYDNTVTGDSNPSASTNFPIAFGRENTATNGGIAFGENNTVSGTGLAFGGNNISSGSRSIAIGAGGNVSGTNSVLIGLNNNFSGTLTNNNTFSVIGGRVGIGTVTPSSLYIMEVDGGHLNVKGPHDYYRHGVRLEDYIKNDVVNFNYITKQNADSDYVKSAVTVGDFFEPTSFFRHNTSSQNIEYTGNKKVGIGTAPRNVVGFQDPVLDVKGGINFEGGLFLSGTRIVPSIDSINAVYISHQTLEYNIGPDSATDFFDSDYVFHRISNQKSNGTRKAFGFGQNDSVENVITSSYINSRVDTTLFLDSAEAQTIVDDQILRDLPFRFNNNTGQVQLTTAEISNANRPNLYGGVKVGIGIAPDTTQTLRVGGDGTNAMEINNGILKLTGSNAKILIEKGGVLEELSAIQFKDDATTGNVRYDGGKNVGINLGAGNIANATLDVGGTVNATALEIGGQDLLSTVLTGTYLKGVLETVGNAGAYLDSSGALEFIDSSYIRGIADSAYVLTAADSAYVRTVAYTAEEKLEFIGGAANSFIRTHPGGDFEIKFDTGLPGSDSGRMRFFETDKTLEVKAGAVRIHHSNRGFARDAITTTDSGVTIDGKLNLHTIPGGTETIALVNSKIANNVVDSDYIKQHIDSAYVLSIADSAYVKTVVDSAYVKSIADSDYIKLVADSAYIQTAADSDYVKTFINTTYIQSKIDSAHVDLITGIGQRDVDFNQRAIFFKNSVGNAAALPNASQNEGSVFVTRNNYKANVATNGNFEKLVHHRHTSDSDYILSVGRSTQLIAASTATTINQFAHNDSFKSAEYLIHLDDSSLGHTQVSKILMTYNKNTVVSTVYGIISTMSADSQLGVFSSESDGTNLLLKMTKSAGTGTVRAKIQRTIL